MTSAQPHLLRADAVVYGTGLAAMACAAMLADRGIQVLLAGPAEPWHARRLPLAGVALVDEPAALSERWLAAGREQRPAGLDWLAAQASRWPDRLARWGVPFVIEEGRRRRRRLAGIELAHAAGDTGAQLTAALSMQLRRVASEGRVRVLSHVMLRDIVCSSGGCAGVVLQHPGGPVAVTAHAVVLAGDSWAPWHGGEPATLGIESLAAALRAGASLRNPDLCDARPDWLAKALHPIALSPGWRAEGAALWCAPSADTPKQERVRLPERVQDGWEAAQWLSRSIAERSSEGQPLQGFLDARALVASGGFERLQLEIEACEKSGLVDPRSAPMPIAVRLSQLRGGVAVGLPASPSPFEAEPSEVLPNAGSLKGVFACPGARIAFSGARGLAGTSALLSLAAAERCAESMTEYLAAKQPAAELSEPEAEPVKAAAAARSEPATPLKSKLRTRARKLFRSVARMLDSGSQPVASESAVASEGAVASESAVASGGAELAGKLAQLQRQSEGHALADAALLARAMLAAHRTREQDVEAAAAGVTVRMDADGDLHVAPSKRAASAEQADEESDT